MLYTSGSPATKGDALRVKEEKPAVAPMIGYVHTMTVGVRVRLRLGEMMVSEKEWAEGLA